MISIARAAKRRASGPTAAALAATAVPALARVVSGRVAGPRPVGDADEDDGEAEQREGDVERAQRPGRRGVAIIMVEELALGRNAERGVVEAEDAAILVWRGVPGQDAEADIGERMAERRKLPVEDADDPGFGRMEHQVAEPEVAMGDRHPAVILRQVRRQPFGQRLQIGNRLAGGLVKLLRPAGDLALEIVSRTAVIGKADLVGLHGMELRQRLGHAEIDAAALLRREIRQGRVLEDAAVEPLHQVERRAQRLVVVMEQDRTRHRHAGRRQGLQHAIFAIDGMGAAQDRAGRLLAQHQPARAVIDEIGRVGLAAADDLQPHLALAEPLAQE